MPVNLFALKINISILFIIILVLLLVILTAAFYYRKKQYEAKYRKLLDKSKKLIAAERRRLEKIFNNAGLGLAIYGASGHLEIEDEKIKSLLEVEELPQTITAFLDKFGADISLKTAFSLNKKQEEVSLEISKGKFINLSYNKYAYAPKNQSSLNLLEAKNKGTIIFARDITAEIEEEQERKKFVANVSHELKTPLTVLKLYVETLLDWGLEEKQEDAIRKDLEQVLENTNRMESLVHDLLLLSKIDSHGKNLNIELIDINKVLKQVVNQCQLAASEKDISLDLINLSKVPKVLADQDALIKIFSNLILNAIKYTENEGKVEVYISRVMDDAVVTVKDNGIGIAPEKQDKIFERFYRVDATGSRAYGGSGLGLSIAKELVESLNGNIEVKSILSSGSEFTVSLPLALKSYIKLMETLNRDKLDKSKAKSSTAVDKKAYEILLKKAQDLGYQVDKLEDLNSEAAYQLLLPYLKASRTPSESNKELKRADADFAGILASFKQDKSKKLEKAQENVEKTEKASENSAETVNKETIRTDITEEKADFRDNKDNNENKL